MKRFVRQRPPGRFLDAGCGPGDYSFYFAANYPDSRVKAIDISQDRIDSNREALKRTALTNLEFTRQDILNLNDAESFDLICCIDVLEHVDQHRQALERLRDALKSDGYLYIHLPLKRERPVIFDRYLREFHEWTKHEHTAPPHSRDSFIELVKDSGFDVLAAENTFNHYLGEFAVSITALFYRNTILNQVILGLLMPFMWLLVYLDYWLSNNKGNALALMLTKRQMDS